MSKYFCSRSIYHVRLTKIPSNDESIIIYHNKTSLQLEVLSDCDNFTVITILYNNDVLKWDYQVTMS